jgi:hypothetical protein
VVSPLPPEPQALASEAWSPCTPELAKPESNLEPRQYYIKKGIPNATMLQLDLEIFRVR